MGAPIEGSRVGELAGLLSAALPHHPITERRLRSTFFQHAGFDTELICLARGADGRVESAVGAVILPDKEGRSQSQLMFVATRPAARRRGLARTLYAELETELRRRCVQDMIIAGGTIPSGLDLRYQAATTMFLRRLYAVTSVSYDQTLDPDSPLPTRQPPPEGFSVRRMTVEDTPLLASFCRREFPDWQGASGLIDTGPNCGVFGAFEKGTGRVAAFAGYCEYVFGPTGTARAHRRKGLGAAVFWPAIRELRAGMPHVPELIERANVPFYARAFGCHIRGTIWHMRKDLTADPAISKGKAAEHAVT